MPPTLNAPNIKNAPFPLAFAPKKFNVKIFLNYHFFKKLPPFLTNLSIPNGIEK